jgi:hypothetical protein
MTFFSRKGGLLHEGVENKALRIYERRVWKLLCDLVFGNFCSCLLMSYIYMDILVKPEILTSYIYGLTFGNAESRLFLFAAQCFNIESMQKVFLCHSCV